MQQQSYSKHSRWVPLYHFFTSAILLLCLGGAAWNIVKAYQHHSGRLIAAVLLGLSYAAIMTLWYSRAFAIVAQDRAIRAEESLRHFALTGKLMDKRLRLTQVIALRFAEDAEFVTLSEKAANENMTPADIKKAIGSWRADHHRV